MEITLDLRLQAIPVALFSYLMYVDLARLSPDKPAITREHIVVHTSACDYSGKGFRARRYYRVQGKLHALCVHFVPPENPPHFPRATHATIEHEGKSTLLYLDPYMLQFLTQHAHTEQLPHCHETIIMLSSCLVSHLHNQFPEILDSRNLPTSIPVNL